MKSADLEIFRQKSRVSQSNAAHILDGSSSSDEDVLPSRAPKILRPAAVHSHSAFPYDVSTKFPPAFPPTDSDFRAGPGLFRDRTSPITDQAYQRIIRTPSEKVIPPASVAGQGVANATPSHRTCNCKRSNCLKLYCDCFASGEYCVNCNCTGCYNNIENETSRAAAVRAILDRNPTAFRPKIASSRPLQISPAALQESAEVPTIASKHNKVWLVFFICLLIGSYGTVHELLHRAARVRNRAVLKNIVNVSMRVLYALKIASAPDAKTSRAA